MSNFFPFGGEASGDDDPFAAMNMFLQDLSRMFSGQSTGSWETAAQLAGSMADEGRSEPNVDPSERIAVEQLMRVAELQVGSVTGLTIDEPVHVDPLTRAQWAKRFLDDERPLLESLSGSIGALLQTQLGELGTDDPAVPQMPGFSPEAMMRQMMSMMGPMMLAMMAGSTAGHLGSRALGHYEMPLPRPLTGPLTVALGNLDEFADDWSLPRDGIRLWVCCSDVAHHQVLSLPHVRSRLDEMLNRYVAAFSQDPDQIEQRLRDLGLDEMPQLTGSEPELEALQRLAGDPEVLLGAMQSDEQRDLMPLIEAIVATIEGYVDWVLDRIGARLIPDYDRATEALRRRRVEAGPASRFVERLFGLELSQSTFDRGAAFIDGVVERAGESTLETLWSDADHLPTPAELDAPGLWLARVGIDGDRLDLDSISFEVPDFPDLDA